MRRFAMAVLLFALSGGPSAFGGEGLIVVKSSHDVKETADRLERLLEEKGLTLFSRIDHAAGAKGIGMDLRPTEVMIFGNPKAGTPLMICEQTVGIDLPLKMLVWEDVGGATRVAYDDPEYLKKRHAITGCDEVLRRIGAVLGQLAGGAAGSGKTR